MDAFPASSTVKFASVWRKGETCVCYVDVSESRRPSDYPRSGGSGIEGNALRPKSDVSLQSSGLALRMRRFRRRIRIRVVDGDPVLSTADRVTRTSFASTKHT